MSKKPYRLDFSVRDYECDLQGIVNNAVYQNYFEHARHELVQSLGINFKDYTEKRLFLMVTRAEIDYKKPLASGDKFYIFSTFAQYSPLKLAFNQEIRLQTDDFLAVKAVFFVTGKNLNSGKFFIPEELLRF